ncbi:19194_t:CDS:2 [Funneliformis geosporum]|uniref:981_t:CDS:1 n=1 Tax=Funneliformis geosporum TaxID=1117311 RepID=A0A9W4SMD0_9GLOM|nr:981_t:CDS:2 [Funneliformis geosporum]CAI2173945.1 19194_t:CDS:2 [Funneliformis geosporum]
MSGKGQVNKIIRFKNDTPNEVINKTEEEIKQMGGTITGKTVITGKTLMFTLPAGTMTTFDANEHVDSVEDDATVTIQ